MKKYLKLLFVSSCLVIIIAIFSIVYGLIAHRSFTLQYIFDANFAVGFIALIAGVVIMFLPSTIFFKDNKSIDRFNYVEHSFDSREKRQQIARITLWLGLFIIILAGVIQLLLSRII